MAGDRLREHTYACVCVCVCLGESAFTTRKRLGASLLVDNVWRGVIGMSVLVAQAGGVLTG